MGVSVPVPVCVSMPVQDALSQGIPYAGVTIAGVTAGVTAGDCHGQH